MIMHIQESTVEWGEDEGEMTWKAADTLAKARGNGWRLPSVLELVVAFDYASLGPTLSGVKSSFYWSGNRYDQYRAWIVGLRGGFVQMGHGEGYTAGVRLVRDVPGDTDV